jgi:hypothetical protein
MADFYKHPLSLFAYHRNQTQERFESLRIQTIGGPMSAFRFGSTIRYGLLVVVILGSALVIPNAVVSQQSATAKPPEQSDPFRPLRPFLGKWEGDSQGEPGIGKMERDYGFVLGDKFVQVLNKAVYAPQKKNPKGETHEDFGFLGYDRGLKKLSFRQFHIEGFVVQYSLESISEDGRSFVFTSTSIENISPGWIARETYRFISDDEFIETFALAGPGKEFETYSETRFRRKR